MAIVGDRQRVAIEYELDVGAKPADWMWGIIRFVVGGRPLGDYTIVTSLRDSLFQIEYVLGLRSRRSDPELFGIPADSLFRILDIGLYLGDDEAIERRALENEWARFDVRPPIEPFGRRKMFLVEDDRKARLVYCDEEYKLMEQELRAGEYDEVLDEARRQLTELYIRAGGEPR